jgi:predicted aspartyl protease
MMKTRWQKLTKAAIARSALLMVALLLPLQSQAGWFRREAPKPGKTTMEDPMVTLTAQTVGNYMLVTAKWDRKGPYHFLIDTGASVTLVSPLLAQRYGTPIKTLNGERSQVAVKSSEGELAQLDAVSIKRIDLGDVHFDYVTALVYDCTAISVHLGIRIDGILGFPLFRDVLLVLDYPRQRVLLVSPKGAAELQPGQPIPFNNDRRTPIIPLRIGDQTFYALIDSGSDCTLRINPIGLKFHYACDPRPGAIVASLTGEHQQVVARLGEDILLGDFKLETPVVDITDELPAIGGSVLRNFTVVFDQERNRVFFHREAHDAITFAAKRSPGFSVTKAGAYWRIVGVVPDSPAMKAGIEEGDLITRIDNEPVEQWGSDRFKQLVDKAETISFAFLVGHREYEMKLAVMDLVP